MLAFPNPNNRLNTDLNSYVQFLGHAFGGRFRTDNRDIEAFEGALRERFGARHAICVYQCRVGIYLAIKALIRPGQEVILSPYTIADVVNMVIFAGGRPVFADVERHTCNISASEVEKLINPKTGAVLITHLHGVAADALRIKSICDSRDVPMVEDCAQAIAVKEQGKPVGTIGDVGVFSFEMHKNIATWMGGAVVTDRDDVVEKIRAELETFSTPPFPGLRRKVKSGLLDDVAKLPILFELVTYPVLRYGHLRKVDFINRRNRRKPQESKPATALPDEYKSRYTPFQARIGLSQLKNIDREIQARIDRGLRYHDGLKDIDGLILPPVQAVGSNSFPDGSNTFLWFPVQYSGREELLRFMFENGRDVAAGHFGNCADTSRYREFQRDCPNARRVASDLLYLPTYPSYSLREVDRNIETIRRFFDRAKPSRNKPLNGA